MRSAFAGFAAVLALVAVAACGEPAPTATPPPTPTLTPTPSATPTPAPTPTPDDPEDLLDAMDERMAEQGSMAFDPAADAWRATAPNQPADYDSAVVPVIAALRDGRALTTGKRSAAAADEEFCDPALPANEGFPLPEWCDWSGVEIYDPSTDGWTLAAPMMQPRSDHTLTLLPDGRVLAAGGQLLPPGRFDPTSELDVLAATEVFDPATLSWTPGPALAEARFGHTATLLPDGRILFIGGIGQEDEPYPPDTPGQVREAYPLRSVEILDLSAPAPDAGEGRRVG